MRRVVVVGVSGAGKSTLARVVAETLGAPYVEMDAIHHQADWTPLPREEFMARLSDLAAGDTWVMDGNYHSARSTIWSRADTVVWLDLPRPLVMRQIVVRTLRRIIRREVLWNGNRERWANFFTLDPEESVIVWAWTRHSHYREQYTAAMADAANAHLRFVRLRSRAEVSTFISALR